MKNCFDDAVNDSLTGSLGVSKLGSGQKVFTGSILDTVTGRHWGSTWGPLREAARIQPVVEQCPAKPPRSPLHC